MLDRLVRPLVRTQIQHLAQTQSANARLMAMVAQWLGYLGVKADVTQLETRQGAIQISLSVNKPEQCSDYEWTKILANIDKNQSAAGAKGEMIYEKMTQAQQSKVHRLLAHVIRAGDPQAAQSWDDLQPQLAALGMEEPMLLGIKAALKVPAMLELLLDDLETDVAAVVLSRAIGIAMMDDCINVDEDTALKAIYSALESKAKVETKAKV